jgi:DNA-binding transcriptional MerR regulator/methylmalonyl-CoA mutase cobalamin-binding subunit
MNMPEVDKLATNQPNLVPIRTVLAELQRLHPDLTQSSLRFLEREGLVEPQRSPGGHRLYSEADVQRIRQIKEWQARRLSLAEIRSLLRIQEQARTAPGLRETVLDLFLQGRTREAQAALLAADETGDIDLSTMFREVITPILVDIGLRWEQGILQVSQEKEISEATREVVVELSLRHRAPHSDGPVMVAATVEGELHELGLRMTCAVLGAAGYQVMFLGANVASVYLAESVDRHHPAVVMLSAGSDRSFAAMARSIEAIRALDVPQPHILVGGAAVAHHRQEVEALGGIAIVTNDYQHIVRQVSALLASA